MAESDMMTASMDYLGKIKPGDIIAEKYRVDRTLGEGGMGLVLAATHIELGSRRAIKVMLPEAASTPMAIERFLREARAASELRSQHVAHVFDVGRLSNGAPFMVLEYLEGQDLAERIEKSGPLPVEQAVHCVIEACDALAEAHGRGIVHRDLKPANLFLARANDGSHHIKVLDFGISKLISGSDGAKTKTGALMGSPLYMSPEQIESITNTDARSDIWSLGIILYELMTNTCPFDGDSVVGILARITQAEPQPLSALQKSVPKGLDKVVLRCLRKNPAERYANVAELCRALAPFAPKSSIPLIERIERIVGASPRPQSSSDLATAGAAAVDPTSTTVLANAEQYGGQTENRLTQQQRKRVGPLAALALAFLTAVLGGAALMSRLGKETDSPSQTSTPTPPQTPETPSAPTASITPPAQVTAAPIVSAIVNHAPTPSQAPTASPAATSAPVKKTKPASTSGPPPRY